MEYLKQFRYHVNNIVPMKEQEMRYYQRFAEFLQRYEDGEEKSDKNSPNILRD
jgi:hypothetical protein